MRNAKVGDTSTYGRRKPALITAIRRKCTKFTAKCHRGIADSVWIRKQPRKLHIRREHVSQTITQPGIKNGYANNAKPDTKDSEIRHGGYTIRNKHICKTYKRISRCTGRNKTITNKQTHPGQRNTDAKNTYGNTHLHNQASK